MSTQKLLDNALTDKKISLDAASHIKKWLTEEKYREYKAELEKMIHNEDWETLEDNFFKVVPFGTGGRRGTVGIGSNRINRITIGESAQGLANYLIKASEDTKKEGVVIGYDTRLTSVEFSELTASVLAANGFTVYLFDAFRATPELSFAVRHLNAAAGVVVSASHNPPPDNGFKAYWRDGGQVVAPHDKAIMSKVGQVKKIITTDFTKAKSEGRIVIIGHEIDEAYVKAVTDESLIANRSAKIVYSPLHGTGISNVLPTLQAAGFTDIALVEEQASPDGNFPNIKNHTPNPEIRDTNELATNLARETHADLAITTDPDADRLGVIARNAAGEYEFLTGNQIAALIGHFVLQQLKSQNKLTQNHFIVKTIVTTDFLNAIAKDFDVKIYDKILIGFKYIAELIDLKEGQEEFVFGGEESHGILKGSYTRDKDAAIAALLICELASELKDQGRTLLDQLDHLYDKYGVYLETLESVMYHGAKGSETMQELMSGLRANPPTTLAGLDVIRVIDRLESPEEGAAGDVLVFNLSKDGATRITVRPSGTEPKLKMYVQVHVPTDDSDSTLDAKKETAANLAADLKADITSYFEDILA